MENNEGPQMQDVPPQRNFVCSGCKWLKSKTFMAGAFDVTRNYYCIHPDWGPDRFTVLGEKGHMLYFNRSVSLPVHTPADCPVLPGNREKIEAKKRGQ